MRENDRSSSDSSRFARQVARISAALERFEAGCKMLAAGDRAGAVAAFIESGGVLDSPDVSSAGDMKGEGRLALVVRNE